jgi:RimJ/RimL family protein N-acetyltransferase
MIQGSCFTLRHVRKDDLPQLLDLLNHPEAKGDYLPLDLILPGTLEQKFADEAVSKEKNETFLIVDEQGHIVGRVFHFKTVPYYNAREIGYGLFSSSVQRKGIMTEAVQLLVNYLFKTLLINRLEIHMHVDHIASEKVAIRCGFQKEGIARGAIFVRGQHADVALYALLRQEWQQQEKTAATLPA